MLGISCRHEELFDCQNVLCSTKLFHADEIFEADHLFPLNSIMCSTLHIIQSLIYLNILYYVEVKNSA
jgi:hypothetical protein